MRFALGKLGKLEIAAVLTPIAMAVAAVTMPVQSDNSQDIAPMAFDSVGAMLQDMDRERSLEAMERYAGLSLTPSAEADHACETADVRASLDRVYSRLQSRLNRVDLGEIARIEQEAAMRRNLAFEMASKAVMAPSLEAQRSARVAALGIRATITALEDQKLAVGAIDDKALAEAVAAALRAAEAALESTP